MAKTFSIGGDSTGHRGDREAPVRPDPVGVIRQQHEELRRLFDLVSSPDADRRAVLDDLIHKMAAHLSAEQSLLYPVVRRARVGGASTARELKWQYSHMERLLLKIERRKFNSPDTPNLLESLLSIFSTHAATFEQAAPALDDRLDSDQKAALATKLAAAERVIVSHSHPHLLALGPLSRMTTRIAAVVDQARDRTVTNR